MIDPLSRTDLDLKAAEEFFALARTATTPFLRAYYQRIGERYLSSECQFKPAQMADKGEPNLKLQFSTRPRSSRRQQLAKLMDLLGKLDLD